MFVALPEDVAAALRQKDWAFYQFIGGGVRFMFAWDARIESVNMLADDLVECWRQRGGW